MLFGRYFDLTQSSKPSVSCIRPSPLSGLIIEKSNSPVYYVYNSASGILDLMRCGKHFLSYMDFFAGIPTIEKSKKTHSAKSCSG